MIDRMIDRLLLHNHCRDFSGQKSTNVTRHAQMLAGVDTHMGDGVRFTSARKQPQIRSITFGLLRNAPARKHLHTYRYIVVCTWCGTRACVAPPACIVTMLAARWGASVDLRAGLRLDLEAEERHEGACIVAVCMLRYQVGRNHISTYVAELDPAAVRYTLEP